MTLSEWRSSEEHLGEFGLKVRESPTSIAITAANKMRTAEPILLAADYKERHIQAFEIRDDAALNRAHLKCVKSLFDELMEHYSEGFSDESGAYIWQGVPSKHIIDFLSSLDLPQIDFIKMKNDSSLLTDYVEGRAAHDRSMDRWTIAIPYTSAATRTGVERIPLPLPRSSRKFNVLPSAILRGTK